MQIVAKIIPGLVALLFLSMGLNALFDPMGAALQFGVEPQGSLGLSTLRGDLGGMFLTCTVLLGLGVWKAQGHWLVAVAILMGLIAAGRIVGFMIDGEPNPAAVTAFVAEIVIAAALYFSSTRLSAGAVAPATQ